MGAQSRTLWVINPERAESLSKDIDPLFVGLIAAVSTVVLDATREITARPRAASPTVLIVTTFDLLGALEAGASGFVLKDADTDEIIDAVRTIADGNGLLVTSITRRVIDEFSRRPAVREQRVIQHDLTPRERDLHGWTEPVPWTVSTFAHTIPSREGFTEGLRLTSAVLAQASWRPR